MANKVEIDVDLLISSFRKNSAIVEREIAKMSSTVVSSQKKIQTSTKQTSDVFDTFSKDVKSFAGGFIAFAALRTSIRLVKEQMIAAFEASRNFETGLIKVGKTTNISGKELEDLSDSIEKMAETLPVSTGELLKNAEAAGQLGVTGSKNILKFASTIAKLTRVTNLDGEFAAATLARILNVTGEATGSIETLASVVVSLGNNFAATESEIVNITNEVARATQQFNVSSADAAALGTTLKSVGVRAEEAGGVISKSFLAIDDAVRSGGAKLKILANLTGIAGDQLKEQFGKDAIGVFTKMLEGLNSVTKAQGSVKDSLASLGIVGLRVQKVIPTLAKNIVSFERSLNLARREVVEITAINEEFNRTLVSSDSKIQLLENAYAKLQKRIGDGLTDAFKTVAPALTAVVNSLADSPTETFIKNNINDADALNKELTLLQRKVRNTKKEISIGLRSPLSLPPLLEGINDLKIRLGEIDTANARKQIKNLEAELASFGSTRAPFTDAIYGSQEANEQRAAEIKDQVANLTLFIATKTNEVRALEQIADNESKDRLINKNLFIEEIEQDQLAKRKERADLEKLAEEIGMEEKLDSFRQLLGSEEAAELISQARKLENEGKHEEAKAKLKEGVAKADAAREKKVASFVQKTKARTLQIETQNTGKQVELAKQGALAVNAIIGGSAKTAFLIGQAAAVAGVLVDDGRARAAATLAAFSTGAAAGPAAPAVIATALAAFNSAITTSTGLSLGIIGAQTVGKFAGGFEQGGVVGGSSFTGDNLSANVNSNETILNPRQAANTLFQLSNDNGRSGSGSGLTADAVRQIVSDTVSSMQIVLQADDNELARSVSRGVSNGVVIGVSE